MKRIIIDIDNTLWDFAMPLWEKLKVHGVPHPSTWTWDSWQDYIKPEEFFGYIDSIHAEQSEYHRPFPEAQNFLASLKSLGYHITIASHRRPDRYGVTQRWLETHQLIFDDLYVGSDKTCLFETATAVVDDSVEILNSAAERQLLCVGLKYSWNRESNHPLFYNLSEVYEYILANIK